MRLGSATLPGVLFIVAIAVIGEGCSGDDGTSITTTHSSTGTGASSGSGLVINTPGSLVTTCDSICSNVVAQCAPATGLYGSCLSACNDLNLVNLGCIDPFASYLACVAGATSVSCSSDGNYVLITPAKCEADREAALNCNMQPGLISACIAVPSSDACGAVATSNGPVFCVGAPEGCSSPQPNPLGIGIYCCP
jgi:hypothetical protein